MKRHLTVFAVAVCALLTVAAVAAAATKKTEVGGVRFDRPDGTAAVVGNVSSSAAKCEARRKVILEARTLEGATKRLGVDTTSNNGGFFFDVRLPQDVDETNLVAPPKKVSKQLRCGFAAGSAQPIDTNPND